MNIEHLENGLAANARANQYLGACSLVEIALHRGIVDHNIGRVLLNLLREVNSNPVETISDIAEGLRGEVA